MGRAKTVTLVGAAALAATVAFGALAWHLASPSWYRRVGAAGAVRDWNAGLGYLFVRDTSPYTRKARGIYLEQNYDRDTGLCVQRKFLDRRHAATCDGYNEKMAELFRANGVPPWSARSHILDDDELVSYLRSSSLKRLPALPWGAAIDVTDNIVIHNGGEFSRWGSVSYGGLIEARRGGSIGGGMAAEGPIFVGRSRTHPHVVIIRVGDDWVGAFHEDGRFLTQCFKPR
jgi:hypothetical protein